MLTHALLLQPDKAVTALTNKQARVRVVSALPSNQAVTASFNSTTLPLLGSSPAVGGYTLVPAGTSAPQLTVSGTTLTTEPWTAAAGSDNTLFVWGTVAAAQLKVFSDDNRLPTSASASRIRLLHGLGDVVAELGLDVAGSRATNASQGAFSAVAQVSAATDTTVSVTQPTTATSVYQLTGKTLDAGAVYSVFLLGDSRQTTGNGLLSTVVKER